MKGIEGSQQDYGMRIYDPRVGKFLSVDPITKDYPELTPYQFASNTPIWAIDLDGLEGAIANPSQMMNMPGNKQYQQFGEWVGELLGQSSETSDRFARGWFGAADIPTNDGVQYTNGDALVALGGAWGKSQMYRTGSFAPLFSSKMQSPPQAIKAVATGNGGRPALKIPTVRTIRQTSSMGSESLDLEPMHTYPMAGREVIVDENLSPKLIQPLERLGIKIKSLPKGTLDPDIIKYAKQGNSIVLTNNIKDFKNSGVTAIKVTSNQAQNFRAIPQLMDALSEKAKQNNSILKPGNTVSLANP